MQLRLLRLGSSRERIVRLPAGFSNNALCLAGKAEGRSPFNASSHPHLLTIAGMAHHKGLHDSLRAVASLAKAFPNFSYLIIGGKRDGGYASHLEGLAARLGIQSHVRLIYNASEELKWFALADADLYIQPSHEEGFCLAFLDAAMVVPRLLGTSTGEMPFIAEGDPSSAIVTPKDARDLEANIVRLLNIPASECDLRGRRARLLQRYSWRDHIRHLHCLYEELSEAEIAAQEV
jgi:glycosyltransferase involved in cell wall biosynthesis